MAPDTVVGGRPLPLAHRILKWLQPRRRSMARAGRLDLADLSEAQKRDLGLADGRFRLPRDPMRD